MRLTANFHFDGQCMNAIQLYTTALGAELTCLIPYADADPDTLSKRKGEPGDAHTLVYHSEMTVGGQRIILSDSLDGHLAKGNSLSLIVTFDTADAVKRAYDGLSEGATVIYPMQITSYSSCFVSLIDRFGMRWELMTEQTGG